MLAAFALGAEGVQVGSRFAASVESSGHPAFKEAIINASDGATKLTLKKIIPVRMIKNAFYEQVRELEDKGASREELAELLGRGRAKRGMFEGKLDEGELEIGQVSGLIHELMPAGRIVEEMVNEFNWMIGRLGDFGNLEMR
jgi:enoyl-[acyl-carrier protein] reductase II